MEIEDIELRSEPVKDILSHPPSWLIRWGSTIIFSTVILLLAVSFVVKYPDMIVAPVTLTTQQPPASLKAFASGNISHLFVEDGQSVAKEEVLAVIENTANFDDWKQFDLVFAPFHQQLMKGDSAGKLLLQKDLSLGAMEAAYTQFVGTHNAYHTFIETHFYNQKIAQIRQKIISQRQLSKGLSEQLAILHTDFGLSKKQFETDKSLFDKSVLTERELEQSEKAFLQQKLRLSDSKNAQINSDIVINDLEAQILQLRQEYREEHTRYLEQLKQSSLSLEASIKNWKKTYLLISPMKGQVSFFKFWANHQSVNAGDEVMVILPMNAQIFGIAAVPQAGFGKIKVGQTVQIRLSSFPFEEFGSVTGKIASISNISRDNKFMVNISLENGLHTSYQKKLSFSQEMQGQAHIVTEDLRIIERIFYQFKKILAEQT